MSKIAVLVTNDFEDSEYRAPVNSFREAGNDIINVGFKADEMVHGKKEHYPVHIDRGIADVSANDFDVLFIPGGFSPDHLRADPDAVKFTKEFFDEKKPVFSICHGVQLLISADVLRGRKVTGWKSLVQDVKNAGAEFIDQEVVVDGNLISSRQPSDIPAFMEKTLEVLKQGRKAA